MLSSALSTFFAIPGLLLIVGAVLVPVLRKPYAAFICWA